MEELSENADRWLTTRISASRTRCSSPTRSKPNPARSGPSSAPTWSAPSRPKGELTHRPPLAWFSWSAYTDSRLADHGPRRAHSPTGSPRRLNSRLRCKSCTTRSSTRPRRRPISAISTRSCSRSSRMKAPRPSPPRWPSRSGVSRSRSATSSAGRLSTLQRCVSAPSLLYRTPTNTRGVDESRRASVSRKGRRSRRSRSMSGPSCSSFASLSSRT